MATSKLLDINTYHIYRMVLEPDKKFYMASTTPESSVDHSIFYKANCLEW